MINDNMDVMGVLDIILTDEFGNIKDTRHVENLVTNAGKTFLGVAILSTSSSPFTHMSLGIGVTAAAVGDTQLQTELVSGSNGATTNSRIVFTSTTPAAGTPPSVVMSTTYGPNVPSSSTTIAVTEAGIFNSATPGAGTMLSHVVFSPINKAPADTLTIQWTVTLN